MIDANRYSSHGQKATGKKNQDWTPGMIVKVGFLSLMVTGIEETRGDYRPDRYLLQHANGNCYAFTPHFGLEKIA